MDLKLNRNFQTNSGDFSLQTRFLIAFSLFLITLVIGTVGFKIILAETWVNSLYFTVVTLSTVGYGDMVPEGFHGHLFTTFFILGGIVSFSYSAAIILGAVIEGEIQGEIRHRRMFKKIDKISGHIILCGYGQVGSEIADMLYSDKKEFVIIERNEARVQEGINRGYLVIHGDGTRDEMLEKAGIHRAESLISAIRDDADNLFIVITARQLNPKMYIVARVNESTTETKMLKAGANKVIRLSHISAQHLAQAVLRPTVLDFIQVSSGVGGLEFEIEELVVSGNSRLVSKSLAEINIQRHVGVIIIGIKRKGGDLIFNPSGQTKIHDGDTLVAMGDLDQLDEMRTIVG